MAFRARAQRGFRDEGRADALLASARFDLTHAAGATQSLTSAIAALEQACRLVTDCHDIYVDLSAAYLTRGIVTGEGSDLLAAVESASAAVNGHDQSASARFNLALALEVTGMPDAAAREWSAVVAIERDDGWRDEAAAHLRETRARSAPQRALGVPNSHQDWTELAHHDPPRARQLGFEVAMVEWGSAVVKGDVVAAAEALHRAGNVGALLLDRQGDRTIQDAVDAVSRASAKDQRSLAVAHVQYPRMVRAYEQSQFESALMLADSILEAATRSPSLIAWTRFYRTSATLHLQPASGSRAAYAEQLKSPSMKQLPALRGRLLWGMTTASLRAGAFEDAARYAQQAQQSFRTLHEREHLGAVQYLEAAALVEVGNEREMYGAIVASLEALQEFRTSNWLSSALAVAAAACANRYPHATAWMREEALAVAREGGESLEIASALLARARSREWLGDTIVSARDLHTADSILSSRGDAGATRWLRADLLTMYAVRATRGRDLDVAQSALDSAEGLLRVTEVPTRLLSTAMARADIASRQHESELPALEDAERLIGSMAGHLATRQASADFAEVAGTVRDRLAVAYLRTGRSWDAMATVELRRGATPPWARGTSATNPSSRFRPTRGEAIVSLHALSDSILGFVVTANGLRVATTPMRLDSLQRIVRRVRSGMEQMVSDASSSTDLVWLYEHVLRPSLSSLGSEVARLRIVVSGELANVPYAALLDRADGRHLVERFTVSMHPSFMDAIGPHAVAGVQRNPSLALIADPAFPVDSYPSLGRLRSAAREAEVLPPLYTQSWVLATDAATPDRVLALLPRANVVQVSAHAVVDERSAERSRIVLAKPDDPARPSSISADAIRRLRLTRLRLVVLASCRSGMTSAGSGAGMLGLAAAFRDAGAQGVIGALWAIDDRLASRFAERLHREYRGSGDGARALRATQLAMLAAQDEEERSVAAWAAFTFTGH